jgi:DNA-directed RNA polymerase specialized sigma24 family protein
MSPELGIAEQELASLHASTLASLPDGCRHSYVMVRDDGTSYQTAAEELGVSRAAVCAHVVAAQRRFRRELFEYGITISRRSVKRSAGQP